MFDSIRAIRWENDQLVLLDQRVLPQHTQTVVCTDVTAAIDAIRDMVVRGAPAIGITAAYAAVLAARQRYREQASAWRQAWAGDLERLAASRPTAVNLFWALDRMRDCAARLPEISDPVAGLLAEAQRIHTQDIADNQQLGRLGATCIEPGSAVLTHCNTGSLATGGFGTALGVIRQAYQERKINQVYADETRPWLQGARLTAWELLQDRIPVTLIAEGAAAFLMKQGKLQWIIVGADRITANGDVANKIGTYSLAVLARQHGVKFMVAAPTSTVDLALADGSAIPIETRSESELLKLNGQPIAPSGVQAWNPVFDVTPAQLIDVIVTERAVLRAPDRAKLSAMMQKPSN